MEDFGYIKNDEENKFSHLLKKFFLIAASLLSVACFVYITINAYYFVYQDKNGNIRTIKSPEGPIKISEDEQTAAENNSIQIDRSIYEDIFGNKKESLKQGTAKIRNAPEPALPPKSKEKIPAVKTANQDQKIIVFSNQTTKENPSGDLLTKNSAEKKSEKPKVAAVNKKRAIRVQIAAMTSKISAEDYKTKLNRLYPSLFSGLKFVIEEVNLGKRGIFYRLQIDNFFNQVDAEEFCGRYISQAQKSKADCIVVE